MNRLKMSRLEICLYLWCVSHNLCFLLTSFTTIHLLLGQLYLQTGSLQFDFLPAFWPVLLLCYC